MTRQLLRLRKWFTRMLAFFIKEVNEVRRQPRLFLSLIGGPFLVLVIFGATFTESRPILRTILVLPAGGVPGVSEDQIRELVALNFTLVDITTDRVSALDRLALAEADVVQIVPGDILDLILKGQQPRLEVVANTVNPLTENWIQYLAYAEATEINRVLLQQQTSSAQSQAVTVRVKLSDAARTLTELETTLDPARIKELQEQLRAIKTLLQDLQQTLPDTTLLSMLQDASGQSIESLRDVLARTLDNLDEVDRAIDDGTLREHLDTLRAANSDLNRAEAVITIFIDTPASLIVSPVQQVYSNVRGKAYSSVIFYAPGVLALLIQHLAVTLGALALVRERLSGAYEIFRVAPLNIAQIVVGKYLGYTLFVGLTATVLTLLLTLIGVPLLGNVGDFIALLLLVTVASLGIGFFISVISQSDSQAIQLSMLVLLLAIFFSGLFLGLDSFAAPARVISQGIPMTHGVVGFQTIMLMGLTPGPVTWGALIAIAAISFTLVVLTLQRQFRRA